jgi:hypothetical protein
MLEFDRDSLTVIGFIGICGMSLTIAFAFYKLIELLIDPIAL